MIVRYLDPCGSFLGPSTNAPAVPCSVSAPHARCSSEGIDRGTVTVGDGPRRMQRPQKWRAQ